MEVTFQDLSAINKLIKNPEQREDGFKQLQQIDREELQAGLQLYWHYLAGKYYRLVFKDTGELECLERANDQYDDLIQTAWDFNIRPKCPKYLYARAYTKFLLSLHANTERSRAYFRNKAEHLTQTGLKYHSDNDSFIWLNSQL